LNYGAVDIPYARRNANLLWREFNQHLYSAVYIIQYIGCATNMPLPGEKLDWSMATELEFQSDAAAFVRISRLLPDFSDTGERAPEQSSKSPTPSA